MIRIKVPPLSLVTQVKGVTRFTSKRDEENEDIEVYLPETRQPRKYVVVSSTNMIVKLHDTVNQVK
jgi:hypothetical protein